MQLELPFQYFFSSDKLNFDEKRSRVLRSHQIIGFNDREEKIVLTDLGYASDSETLCSKTEDVSLSGWSQPYLCI
jgi:hypothetical protein